MTKTQMTEQMEAFKASATGRLYEYEGFGWDILDVQPNGRSKHAVATYCGVNGSDEWRTVVYDYFKKETEGMMFTMGWKP